MAARFSRSGNTLTLSAEGISVSGTITDESKIAQLANQLKMKALAQARRITDEAKRKEVNNSILAAGSSSPTNIIIFWFFRKIFLTVETIPAIATSCPVSDESTIFIDVVFSEIYSLNSSSGCSEI